MRWPNLDFHLGLKAYPVVFFEYFLPGTTSFPKQSHNVDFLFAKQNFDSDETRSSRLQIHPNFYHCSYCFCSLLDQTREEGIDFSIIAQNSCVASLAESRPKPADNVRMILVLLFDAIDSLFDLFDKITRVYYEVLNNLDVMGFVL